MKLYAPKYYNDFVCIADKCKHSCCIGWEIAVDDDTLDTYNSADGGYAEVIKSSIESRDVPHFKLTEHGRCPHLNGNGLCNIILNMGEVFLCDICREHPRFYNDTPHGKEVGLGLSCEEACRIILTSDTYSDIVEIGCIDDELEALHGFDPITERAKIYDILRDSSLPYSERIMRIADGYGVSLDVNTKSGWADVISSLEYLENEHKDIFSAFSPDSIAPPAIELYAERLFAYFVYRHCSSAESDDEFKASLGFALFCERLFVSVVTEKGIDGIDDVIDVARIISEEIEYSEDNTNNIKLEFLF